MTILQTIVSEFKLQPFQAENTLALFANNDTVPFIARYRKEVTGGLDEIQLRAIEERFAYLTELEKRKETVLKQIEAQGKLTDQLRESIGACTEKSRLEDLYLPYKPKKKTKGTK